MKRSRSGWCFTSIELTRLSLRASVSDAAVQPRPVPISTTRRAPPRRAVNGHQLHGACGPERAGVVARRPRGGERPQVEEGAARRQPQEAGQLAGHGTGAAQRRARVAGRGTARGAAGLAGAHAPLRRRRRSCSTRYRNARVAEQVAPPHALRLHRQPEDPLEPVVGQPVRRPRHPAGDVVEQGAHGPDHGCVDPVAVGSTHSSCWGVPIPTSSTSGGFSAMCSSTRSEWGRRGRSSRGGCRARPAADTSGAGVAAAAADEPGSAPSRYRERPAAWQIAAMPQIQSAPVIRWGTGSPISRAASRTP